MNDDTLQHREATAARPPRRLRPELSVGLAQSEREVLEAKRLRWRVFSGELGARLPSRTPGVDHDFYDPYCRHLIARDEASGEVVGTYRILTPEAARRIGGYYTEDEFDLTRLVHLRPSLVEIGRSCVHPEYRTGATIALLWAGLARFMTGHGYRHLVGCASVGMADGGRNAVALNDALAGHLAPPEYRVQPRHALPLDALRDESVAPEVPPLLRGYLRAGAWICGAPAWDPDFNAADFPILLAMDRLDARHVKHFRTA